MTLIFLTILTKIVTVRLLSVICVVYIMPRNNTCLEEVIVKAHQRLNPPIQLTYLDEGSDDQLMPDEVLVEVDFDPGTTSFELADKTEAYQRLQALDETKQYLVRTGRTGGASGHFRLMFFDAAENTWCMYSSLTNNYTFRFTEDGEYGFDTVTTTVDGVRANSDLGFNSDASVWGDAYGQYSIALHELTHDRLEAIKQYAARARGFDSADTYWKNASPSPALLIKDTPDVAVPLALTIGYWVLNIVIAILTLGIQPLVSYCTTGDWRLFKPEGEAQVESLEMAENRKQL